MTLTKTELSCYQSSQGKDTCIIFFTCESSLTHLNVHLIFAMSVQSVLGPDETDSEDDEDDEVGDDARSQHDGDSDFEGAEPPAAPAQDDESPAQEAEEAPSNTNNVEEDGHINAGGTDYRQPCRSSVPLGQAPRMRSFVPTS